MGLVRIVRIFEQKLTVTSIAKLACAPSTS